jgi:hypothetical protein
MKSFFILTLLLMLALTNTACGARGPQQIPTAGTVDLQGTIAAAAFTVIAETQAAIPTATPVPPTATFTDTPLPTLTSIPLTPMGMTMTPASAGSSGGNDPCINKTLPEKLTGDPIRIRLDNSTKSALSTTVYLNQTVPNGQCGYRSYTIDPGQNVVLNNLVAGCYTIWAWNPDPDNYFIVTNGTSCLDTSDTWVFDISTSSIKLGP